MKIQRKSRSRTIATYFQSSFTFKQNTSYYNCTVQHCTVLSCIVYSTTLYYTVLYYNKMYYNRTVQHTSSPPSPSNNIQVITNVRYSTVLYYPVLCIVLHCTTLYCTTTECTTTEQCNILPVLLHLQTTYKLLQLYGTALYCIILYCA